MWEILRNLVITIVGLYTLSKVGPPAVERYFLLSIEYVAGSFHGVAPQPAPATAFTHMQTPIAAGPKSTPLQTLFVRQAGYETISTPKVATITGTSNSEGPLYRTHSGHFSQSDGLFSLYPIFGWSHRILYYLRQLLDSFLCQVAMLTTLIISCGLLKYREKMTIENLAKTHKREIVGVWEESSALTVSKDLEIASLSAQNNSQRDALDAQEVLLNAAKEEARRANEAKKLAEEQAETEIAKLKSSLTSKDDLAKAIERAESAEKSNKSLESNARKSRSDFDSALQKKENDISAHKGASEKAVEDRNTARRELKDSRTKASRDKKNISELVEQAAELEAQVKEKDAVIGRKDGLVTKLREEKQTLMKDVEQVTIERNRALRNGSNAKTRNEKLIGELQKQVTEVKNLRKVAEAKASEQEALAAKATEQQKVAEEGATQQAAREAEAEQICKAEKENTLREEANAAEVAEQLKTKDEEIAALRADAETSCGYLQRLLDTARVANEEKDILFAQAKADAQKAEAEAKETQEALRERIANLEEQHKEKSVWSDIAAPNSDLSSQDRPVDRLPDSNNRPTGHSRSKNRPAPRWEPPAEGTTKTPPEARGLPANTPTGPKAGRRGRS